MARIDLEGLSLKQLLDLREKLDVKIEEKRKEDREDVKRAIADMAEKRGFSMDDLFGGRRGKGKGVAVKYRNPDNPSETWTGRGRKPNWLVNALKKPGVKMESFSV
ncbi:H-NS family nucleoid-associated regulatory protein [Hyphomicrobium zavarzinii]|jgi:DNA-binding protein H-NS|uniref:H-NS histone family protein n=1 Tax=Hyphomicrobium zavarzinii TaxID=48292 RepID=UPI0003806313|nr:H-NS histone family protein [Hyphomicrobium zavarzinii]